ncbi:unnamed protein product [Ixodes pacificus]
MPQVASRHSGVSSRPSSRWGDTVLRQFDDDTATFLSKDCHTWSCFTVTTPSELTKERFEEKSRDLASELQRRLNLSQPPVIRVRHRATMGSTHRPSLFFSVSYVGVVQQTKLRGILSCFGSEEHNLLLCRGSRLVMSLVTVFVADAFRCYVNPLLFGPGDLAFGLAFWSALAFRVSGFDGDLITIQLKHPDVPNFAIDVDLPVDLVGQELDDAREIVEDDGPRVLTLFYETRLVRCSGFILESFGLQGVTTPGLAFNAEGSVRFLKPEFACEALAFLTKIAAWKGQPEIEERSVEGSD